ncbi:zinc finger protein ZAT9-like [Eucalyptus grandis]|uniref:zinc finger protein ZAT9-like n=1 Tax=Eucalyptus grandis TaxID=71139 RepID=UPI00192EC2E5|nr:zinc finger protein ZAT9-like [Eucalyptus grandis]
MDGLRGSQDQTEVVQLPHQDRGKMAEPDPSERSESWSQVPKKDPLWIKLKISKTEQGGEPSEQEEPPSAAVRVCEFCGKRFMNGKALGGHIRIHNQEKNKGSSSKKTDESRLRKQKAKCEKHVHEDLPALEKGRDFDCSEKDKETPCCYICDRNFPSMKSLFGHMRFHPDRNWRGVQPPAQEKDGSCTREVESVDQKATDQGSACLEAGSSGCLVDLLKGLPSWSRTDKRGRKSLIALEPEAIDGLMKLACAASYDSGISDDQVSDESPLRKRRLDEEELPGPKNQNPEPTESQIQQSTNIEGEGSYKAVRNQDYELEHADRPRKYRKGERFGHNLERNPNMEAGKKIKVSGMCKTQDLSTNKEVAVMPVKEDKILTDHRFKCMTCEKTFPTFQALGGHRSSHNKERGNVQPPEASLSTGASGTEKKIAPSAKIHAAETNNCATSSVQEDFMTHRCEICCKKFPTGQALGGHKRCHWAGQTEGPPSSEVVSPGDQASQSGPRALAFDLNEPPPMDEEDGVISGFNRA